MNTPTAAAEFSLVDFGDVDVAFKEVIGASKTTFMLNERYKNENGKLRSFLDRLLLIRRGDSTLRNLVSSQVLDEAVFMDFYRDDYKSVVLGSAKRSLWDLVPHD